MPHTKSASHVDESANRLASEVAYFRIQVQHFITSDVSRQVEALNLPASDLHKGLSIWISKRRVWVAPRSAVPSAEDLHGYADEYSYRIDLASNIGRDKLLAGLQLAAFERLATMPAWVWVVDNLLVEGHLSDSWQVTVFKRLLDANACEFALLVSGVLETWTAD